MIKVIYSFFFLLSFFSPLLINAQNETQTEYFDQNWQKVATKEEARFYRIIQADSFNRNSGFWKEYYISGKLYSTVYFKSFKEELKDRLHTFWYENGIKKEEISYRNGVKDGICTVWYENGQKSQETNWKNGFAEGNKTAWYEVNYHNGNLVVYYPDGKLKRKAIYENLVEKNSECYTNEGKEELCDLPFFRMPAYEGGMPALNKLVMKNLKYPKSALKKNIQGKVYIIFTINEDKSFSDVFVAKGLTPEMDAEAIRIVNLTNDKWIPGVQLGKIVKVKYTLPIKFSLWD